MDTVRGVELMRATPFRLRGTSLARLRRPSSAICGFTLVVIVSSGALLQAPVSAATSANFTCGIEPAALVPTPGTWAGWTSHVAASVQCNSFDATPYEVTLMVEFGYGPPLHTDLEYVAERFCQGSATSGQLAMSCTVSNLREGTYTERHGARLTVLSEGRPIASRLVPDVLVPGRG